MKRIHAEITRFAKPQVDKSRGIWAKTNHTGNHGNHVSDKTAGQEITRQITQITGPEITPTPVPEGDRVAVSATSIDSSSAPVGIAPRGGRRRHGVDAPWLLLLGAVLKNTPRLTDGLCIGGPEDFERMDAEGVERALHVCARCPERVPCRRWVDALPRTHRPVGVVGGRVVREAPR
jgi:hypothetical protein